MVIGKSKITRFVSGTVAAACLAAGINFAPFTMETEAADLLTAFEITEEMQIGWNLGNTLDSYMSKNNVPLESYGLEAETCWGNPKTTQAMIDAVKAKGFNTIRVPVTWFQHVDKSNGYKIDEAWLARVKEIVDYCYNSGLYVIINLHHEEPYANRATLGADYEEITGYVSSIWSQVAETFKDYDQHLVFEIMNEPRAKGTDHEWWGPTKEETDTINKINADALEIIRGTGDDNNDTRLVMLPGYCASSDTSMMSKIVVPEDDDYVAVSVHAYTPYNFTMNPEVKDHSTFTAAYATELTSIFDGIRKTFGDKDIPVVLGEFSASNYDNTEARVEWATAYITQTKQMGIPCVLWDNNVAKNNGGEAHGYFNRSALTWYEESEIVVDTMLNIINNEEIVWGSARKSPTIEHEDISTGYIVSDEVYEIDASVKNGNCTPGLNATWKELEGGDVAIQYTGDQPVIAVCDAEWLGWTEIKPYDDKDGIAYYSAKHIASAWGEDKLDEIAHLFARTNGITTITTIAIIGEGKGNIEAPPEDKTKIYNVDFADRGNSDIIAFTIEGAAGSVTNGCVGYMGEEWIALEWDGEIGADGKLNVEVDISTVPDTVKSAQIQLWWCDDENGEMTAYSFKAKEQTPSIEVPEDMAVTVDGDANNDGILTIADAAAVYQALGNTDKYGLSKQGAVNADVDDKVGITAGDALRILMMSTKTA